MGFRVESLGDGCRILKQGLYPVRERGFGQGAGWTREREGGQQVQSVPMVFFLRVWALLKFGRLCFESVTSETCHNPLRRNL